MPDETKTVPSPEPAAAVADVVSESTAAGEEPKAPAKPEPGSDAEVRVLRLNRKLADLEKQLVALRPYAQFGMTMANDERGRPMVQRYLQGQPVFRAEEGEEEPVQAPMPAPGLDEQRLTAILDSREAAKRQIEDLMDMAQEKLPQFKKLRRSEKFSKVFNAALATVWNDPNWEREASAEVLGWGDENMAKNYTALEMAYRWHLASDPKVIEAAKEAGKLEAKERAGAALAGEVSSASGTKGSSELAKPKSAAEDMIQRMMNSGPGARSFRNVGRRR